MRIAAAQFTARPESTDPEQGDGLWVPSGDLPITSEQRIDIPFTPTQEVAVILHQLLDMYERRGEAPKQTVRVKMEEVEPLLPGYYSQADPTPRVTANEQLGHLAGRDWVHLTWQPGQTGHLLEVVALEPSRAEVLYALLAREPLAERRGRLRDLLLADLFRFELARFNHLHFFIRGKPL